MTKIQRIVYIIDDDASIRKSLSRLLRSADINSETFSSPEDFLSGSREEENACIISDLRMPETKIPAGEHQVRMEFDYDGGGLGKGAKVSLYIDGDKTGEGRIERSTPMLFSLDDKTNVGCDRGTPVSDDYTCAGSDFNGQIKWIQIDLGDDAKDADHLITPEERYRIAVTLQ